MNKIDLISNDRKYEAIENDEANTISLNRSKNKYDLDKNKNVIGLNLCETGLEDVSFLNDPDFEFLQVLNLSGNLMTEVQLPENMVHLRVVDFSDCKELTSLQLPQGATQLERLDVSDSKLERLVLPESLRELAYFDGSRNSLKELVLSDVIMPSLEYLDLSGNKIENLVLPDIFANIKYLYLGDCTLKDVPAEIYKEKTNSAKDVKLYFLASSQSGEVFNTEAKFVFFGNGRAGKTTLSKQLREGTFDPEIKLTHGIIVSEWVIPYNDFPDSLKLKINQTIDEYKAKKSANLYTPERIVLNVWDFGGQEYFHATHRLFMNNNVLYLVVWDAATNHQDEIMGNYPTSYWKDNIAHYAQEYKPMFVQNKVVGAANFDHENLQYKIDNRNQKSQTSLQQYELDVTTLRNGVLEQLVSLNYIAKPIAAIFDAIRYELKQRKNSGQNYLKFADFEDLCRDMDNTPSKIMQDDEQIKQLTEFLHDTGAIICYRFNKDKLNNKLDNYVFINPDWVTQTIYKILDEGLIDKGEFDKNHVIKVVTQEKVEISDSNLWIELMKEFELIYAKKDSPDQFVAPQYLPEVCQDLKDKAYNNFIEEHPYQLVLHYPDFLPRSVISRFICRYGNLAKDYYWKKGIVVHKDGEKAMVICDYNQKRIAIRVKDVNSQLKLELLETLRKIDDTDKLEVLVSDESDLGKLIGPVNLLKLEERRSKNKSDIEWKDKDFEVDWFKGVFREQERFKEQLNNNEKINESQISESKLDSEEHTGPNSSSEERKAQMKINQSSPNLDRNIESTQLSSTPHDEKTSNVCKILMFTANPANTTKLDLSLEIATIYKKLNNNHGIINLIPEEHVSRTQFKEKTTEYRPNILHFSGHGEYGKESGGIVLHDKDKRTKELLSTNKLAELFKFFIETEKIELRAVILNSCYSKDQAEDIAKTVPFVIGTNISVKDGHSIAFSEGFYFQLNRNVQDIEWAYKSGRIEAHGAGARMDDFVLYKDGQLLDI